MARTKPVFNAVRTEAPVSEIMQRIRVKRATADEIIFLGNLMEDFKKTEAYELLRINTLQTQQAMLSGLAAKETHEANFTLGILTGLQNCIDMVDGIITRGRSALDHRDKQREIQEEATLPEGIKIPKKRRRSLGPDEE